MVNSLDEARRLSVGDAKPIPLGYGQWVPGGYTKQGNQWVRPFDAPPVTSPGSTAGTTGPNQTAMQTALTSTPNNDRWNANAKAQMDAVGQKYGRTWRDDEYDQWLGPNGYISKNDIDGTGRQIAAYSGEGDIDPYWLMRMGYHATGDEYGNGTTPEDANTRKGQGGMNTNTMAANAISANGINALLSGDPMARINQALQAINGQGQVNMDALLRQLGA